MKNKELKEYKIGTALWDSEEMLYGCKVGETNGTLYATVWEKTESICTHRAKELVRILNNNNVTITNNNVTFVK